MAGKRSATRDINHQNWDEEDEPEEAGEFQRASEDILKTRVIKTAKRRNPVSLSTQGGETPKSGAFSSFSGFSKPATSSSSVFSFLSSPKPEPPKVNGVSTETSMQSSMFKPSVTQSPMFNTSVTQSPMFNTSVTQPPTFKTTVTNSTDKSNGNSDEYYGKLKGLNESVAKVIQTHVNSNPFINLQPIFKDYEKYINELESLRGLAKNETKQEKPNTLTQSSSPKTNPVTPFSSFVFKATTTSTEIPTTNTNKPTTSNSLLNTSQEKPQFSFGFNSTQATPPTITFGVSNPSYSFNKPSEEKKSTENEEDNEDEPPKVEFTPVVEEGHVYTTRCKVFVKKDNSYADRGVGNLYLKPVPGGEKFQLIVRADTNLGNLLCNFILSEGIPTQRLGMKDVMLVCLPTPESKPPPVPVLLRVKSPEDADDLLAVLEKHKK